MRRIEYVLGLRQRNMWDTGDCLFFLLVPFFSRYICNTFVMAPVSEIGDLTIGRGYVNVYQDRTTKLAKTGRSGRVIE